MKKIIDQLAKVVGRENLFTEKEDMLTYSYDAAVLDSMVPGLAVMPETCEQLGQIVKHYVMGVSF